MDGGADAAKGLSSPQKIRDSQSMRTYLVILTILFASLSTSAADKDWGLGLIINNPTGFSAKHRLSSSNSIDAAIGYNHKLTLHATYLWETNEGIALDRTFLGYYFGVGGSLHSWDKTSSAPGWAKDQLDSDLGLAVRGVGGLNYYFQKPSIEVFAELALTFFFVPATSAWLDLSIGARYYF